jgi:hypothetical protein
MISAVRIARLDPPNEVARSDPQLHTLTCMFCEAVTKSPAALARHLHREHPHRFDFPVLFFGRTEDPAGSAAMATLVLKEIDVLLFQRLRMQSGQGRMVPAFKRIAIKVNCPPGAFDCIVQSFSLRPSWRPSGSLIVDGVTGATIMGMLGTSCLERQFPTYKAVIEQADSVKMKLVADVLKDHLGILRRETYYLKLCLVCRSRLMSRAPRVIRIMN